MGAVDAGAPGATTREPTAVRSRTVVAPGRRKDIQGLRALAVVLVVAFHAGLPVSGGFVGVDVFFVISGFVITMMLLRHLSDNGRISFATFYARRVRRILPALALLIVFVAGTSFFFVSPLSPKHITARTGMSASLFVANIFLYTTPRGYFGVADGANPLLHTWSLSVEEQFYLVFPLLLLGAWLLARFLAPRSARRTRLAFGALALVALASFAINWVAVDGNGIAGPHLNDRFAFYMAPARAWEFLAGALLVFAVGRLSRMPRSLAIGIGAVGLALVLYAAFTFTGATPFPGTAALLPVVGTCMLLAAGTATDWGVSGVFSTAPATRIGDLSYSWYLWHWPLIVFAAALWPGNDTMLVLAAIVSYVPATLAYRYFENPIRRNTKIVGVRAAGVALVCILVPIMACLFLNRFPLPVHSAAASARLDARAGNHVDETHGCIGRQLLGFPNPACTWTVPHARGTIVLIGDSNAGQFAEPVIRASKQLGYDTVVSTFHGCPFVETLVYKKHWDKPCLQAVETSLDVIASSRPALVVMASSTPELMDDGGMAFQDPQTGHIARTIAAKTSMWHTGEVRVVRRLAAAHVPGILVETIPQFPAWQPDCAAVRVYLAPQTCGTSLPRSSVDAYRHAALSAEESAVQGVHGSTVYVDFADQMCRATCSTNEGNFWWYRDQDHLSVPGALRLTASFEQLMRQQLHT
jgi:peptidoglycan/LPS O-acetylase OafA/YrhL